MGDSLGDRIKRYEKVYQYELTPKSCLFIRVDGRAFHTLTKDLDKPFSSELVGSMVYATTETARDMQGFKLAYTQSDEATFMLTDFDTFQTQGWFDYNLNKVVSMSASLFTAHFNNHNDFELATFDSRAFIVPENDWPNVFIWRQKDWERNSIQMFARAHFSHKELHNKNTPQIHDMLHAKGLNWNNLSEQIKNGTFIMADYEEQYFKATYESLELLLTKEK